MSLKNHHTWQELFEHAKTHSPFYQKLYQNITNPKILSELPMINPKEYWEANSVENNQLLTIKSPYGLVFRSGGTTGQPKFSYYTHSEWDAFTTEFGIGLNQNILSNNDKIANLFYGGELYASLIFITDSLKKCQKEILQFPLGGAIAYDELIRVINHFKINVLAGLPTFILNFSLYLQEKKISLPINKIIYGGEKAYPEQEIILKKSFDSNLKVSSIGLASVDGGHLGFVRNDFRPYEHEVFSSTIIEIIDDFGKIITQPNCPGLMVYTNLTRKLMPLIRYPIGDLISWSDYAKKRYLLLGRGEVGARFGPVTLNHDDVDTILKMEKIYPAIISKQMIIDKNMIGETLEIKIALEHSSLTKIFQEPLSTDFLIEIKNQLLVKFFQEKPAIKEALEKNLIGDFLITFTTMDQLEKNEVTGKLKFVIDRRIVK